MILFYQMAHNLYLEGEIRILNKYLLIKFLNSLIQPTKSKKWNMIPIKWPLILYLKGIIITRILHYSDFFGFSSVKKLLKSDKHNYILHTYMSYCIEIWWPTVWILSFNTIDDYIYQHLCFIFEYICRAWYYLFYVIFFYHIN